MMKRRLGASGIEVFAIGLGCMGMSEHYGPGDEAHSTATLHRALELGVELFDTADMYGMGANEMLLGRALAGKRDRVRIATKFGIVRGPDGSLQGINGRPEYVAQCCERSLKRLNTDVIDLYFQHRVDPRTPIEETVGAMARLVEQGKVRAIGLSEAGPATLRRAAAVHPIAALQTEYSLWSREPEDELFDLCAELGVAFIAYAPLGRGFLSGSLRSRDDLAADDVRRVLPRFSESNFASNLSLADAVARLSAKKGCTPSQLALAWMLRHEMVLPIPGTRSPERLEQNVAAARIELDPSDLAELDRAFPVGVASGMRYPELAMRSVDG